MNLVPTLDPPPPQKKSKYINKLGYGSCAKICFIISSIIIFSLLLDLKWTRTLELLFLINDMFFVFVRFFVCLFFSME